MFHIRTLCECSRASRLVDRVATRHGPHDLDVLDFVLVDCVRIVCQNEKVRELAGSMDPLMASSREAYAPVIVLTCSASSTLIRSSGLIVAPRTCHHSLNVYQRGEWSGAEVSRTLQHGLWPSSLIKMRWVIGAPVGSWKQPLCTLERREHCRW
jgi:hypothetical protein